MEKFDLLIIGGGIHGTGVAWQSATRGFRTLLVEKKSLASGTSSQSTKLIHGGLRYLEQLRLKLVYESLHERETLLRLFPELVHRQWFYIPVFEDSQRPAWMIHLGLMLYWLLSGGASRFRRVPPKLWHETLPGFSFAGVRALLAYEDAATDDAALVHAVAQQAIEAGAIIREHEGLHSAKRTESGWDVLLESGERCETKILVNAAGPWINHVADLLDAVVPKMEIQLVQGIHLLLPRACNAFIYVEAPDGRAVFVRPWNQMTLIGTTETLHHGPPEKASPKAEEIHYLLDVYNRHFPGLTCAKEEIAGTFCGLRVLPAKAESAFSASRETLLLSDPVGGPDYIAIYGGKLTTFRHTAMRVLRLIR